MPAPIVQAVIDRISLSDPQIHTLDGRGFGKGNAGLQGVRQFFTKHKCNGICSALKLKSVTGRVKQQDVVSAVSCSG